MGAIIGYLAMGTGTQSTPGIVAAVVSRRGLPQPRTGSMQPGLLVGLTPGQGVRDRPDASDRLVDRDRISDTILLGASRSEDSAQSEVLDMQEVTGSSPVSPTKPLVG
jgi:hypothetical protein